MLSMVSLVLSGLSLIVAGTTAWLTLWRRGTVCMAQPPSVYFGPDGARERHPKVFVRALLYATSIRGRIVQGMFVRLRRGDSSQTFPVWVSGDTRGNLSRGARLAVKSDGIALHHHFLLPGDGTTYEFLPGAYELELCAVLVGESRPRRLGLIKLAVSDLEAARLREDQTSGLYFDWSPDTGRYSTHIDQARLPEPPPMTVGLSPRP
jgi:hypothetical protein